LQKIHRVKQIMGASSALSYFQAFLKGGFAPQDGNVHEAAYAHAQEYA
jgi:hypothetical protein